MNYEKYKNKMEYPKGLPKPFLSPAKKFCEEAVAIYAKELKEFNASLPAWIEAHEKYRMENHRLEQLFQKDAIDEVGLTNHPKAQKIFDKAWADGHSGGLENVMYHLEELADLIL